MNQRQKHTGDRPVFRMREHGDSVDEFGIVTDSDGVQWGTADALLKLADALEAKRDKEADKLFKPAPRERVSSEPSPQGGVLDALAPSIWRNRKDAK